MRQREPERSGVHFYRTARLPGVHCICGTDVRGEFPRHVHDGFCIGLVEKGGRVISRQGISEVIPEGFSFVINSGVAHSCRSLGDKHSYFIVYVKKTAMKFLASSLLGEWVDDLCFERSLIDDCVVSTGIRRIFSDIGGAGHTEEGNSIVSSFLSDFILAHGKRGLATNVAGPHREALDRAVGFMEDHYDENVSLGALSSLVGLSPCHFHRLFSASKGISPHEYLLRIRIRKARELLREGYDITSVAMETGFADQSHLTRSFKKAMGITPGLYRNDLYQGPHGKNGEM